MEDWQKTVAWLAGVGMLVAVGRALTSKEPLSVQIIVGRTILGGALGLVAGLLLLQFPGIPMPALIGAGAGIGILGEQMLELVVRRFITFRFGGDK